MISIDFHYETFLLLFLVSALVICIVLKLKKRKFYDFIFNLSGTLGLDHTFQTTIFNQ